ncbi:MAG: type I restriction-modification system, DNA specificity (S) subunit [Candidatus Malacoplasma girerdii]|nr:MAG: type I restriction-modification system, DNA specificity (S) subunit [Candidatus Malacoplasma girerdii]
MDIKWVKLTELFVVERGKTITNKYIKENPGKYPVYTAKTVGNLIAGYVNSYTCDGEYLMIAADGANAGNVIYLNGKLWISNHSVSLKVIDQNKANIKFYLHYLKTVAKQYVNYSAPIPSIPHFVIKDISVPLIPIEQQNRIASVLDTIAELKAELRARDKQNKYYQEHLLSEESLSGKLWGFKEEIIKYVKLSEIFEIQRGKVITKEWIKNHPGKYPVYSAKTVGDGVMGYINQFANEGELLMVSSYGAKAGNITYLNKKCWISNNATILKLKNKHCNIKFYMHYLSNVIYSYINYASSIPFISPEMLKKIIVPLPSLKIQNKIVAIMDKLESLINSVNGDIPVEISTREDQYKYYSELLLSY